MSADEIDSDEQHNSSDGANASRKGQPWTEEEHLAFLAGLRQVGRGNWRAISKSFVPSRTPTQVASHAQKHFMRVAGATKRKSRFTNIEVIATGKTAQAAEPEMVAQASFRAADQQGASAAQQAQVQQAPAAFPAMPFSFMHPMMFGFPAPFFPPFMCPPPAFAAAALSAMQKHGQVPMMMPPMFPMAAAAMAAMNPFFMAQQMAAAAQAAAAANAAAVAAANAAQAATSGGATTAGTGATATTDTANSGEVTPRPQSPPSSPPLCKPEPVHARLGGSPAAVAAVAAATAAGEKHAGSPRGGVAGGGGGGGWQDQRGGSSGGGGSGGGGGGGVSVLTELQLPRGEDAPAAVPFHASSHSAFRPPQASQEIKTES